MTLRQLAIIIICWGLAILSCVLGNAHSAHAYMAASFVIIAFKGEK